MSVARPEILALGLIILAGLAFFYRVFARRREAAALTYSSLAFALGAMRPARWPAAVLFATFLIGTGALLTALAGPRFTAKLPAKDGVVVICIDTSGSMRSEDVEPTRWQAALAAAHAFVDAVPAGTKVGIVSFSSGANLIEPPSDDLDAVRESLDRVPGPDGATAIGDALTLAAAQMPSTGKRVIVLLTDGVNNRGGDPVAASEKIGAKGITIETVGVGTSGSGQMIPGTNEPADLDATALRTIAANAGGRYVEAADAQTLRTAFANIALSTVWESRRVDGSFPFAFAGGALLLGAFLGALGAGRL